MKVIVCLSLLALLCNAQVRIVLQNNKVKSAAGVTDDLIHTYTTQDNQRLVFDTRAQGDYKVVVQPSTCTKSTGTVQALNSKATTDTAGSVQATVNINGVTSDKLSFQTLDFCQNEASSLVDLGIGLQIPNAQTTPYLQTALSNAFRTLTQSFSFYFSENINLLFLGDQQYFLADNTVTFPVYWSSGNSWQLNVKSLQQTGASNTFTLPTGSNTATFDSTTAKILVPQTVLDQITKQVQNLGSTMTSASCASVRAGKTQLTFSFVAQPDDPNNKFVVDLNDLIVSQADGSCSLLLQGTTDGSWVLGTSFLQNVYTYFNYDAHTITLGNMNEVTIDNLTPDSTWATVLISVGVFLTLISLYILVSLIKPLGNVPVAQQKPKVVQSQVQQFVPAQRFIVYQQPVQSVPFQVIQQSPSRIQAQTLPQSQVFQPQTIYRQQ